MQLTKDSTGADVIAFFAPPIETLEALGRAKLPPATKEWFDRMMAIRGDTQPELLADVTPEAYGQAALIAMDAVKAPKEKVKAY